MKSFFLKVTVLIAACTIASDAYAQRGPQGGTAEVAIGTGYAYLNTGNDTVTGKKNHPEFHVSLSYNILKQLAVGFEYALVPLDSEQQFGVKFTEHLRNFGGVGRVGLFQTHGAMPYVLISGGEISLLNKGSLGNQNESYTQSGTYFGTGGGVNLYLPHGFGVRPEFRFQRQSLRATSGNNINLSDLNRNELAVTGTLFYSFGKTHR
jgi:hypothetical protein